jgi:hypothetical protein
MGQNCSNTIRPPSTHAARTAHISRQTLLHSPCTQTSRAHLTVGRGCWAHTGVICNAEVGARYSVLPHRPVATAVHAYKRVFFSGHGYVGLFTVRWRGVYGWLCTATLQGCERLHTTAGEGCVQLRTATLGGCVQLSTGSAGYCAQLGAAGVDTCVQLYPEVC